MTRDEIKAAIAHFQGLHGGADDSTITVGEIADRYYASLEFRELNAAPTEPGRFNLNSRRLLGDTKVGDLTREKLEWYRRVRASETGKGRRLTKPATRNREVFKLSAMLTWAAEREIIPVNPIYHATTETEDNVRQTCPTLTDVNKILLACNRRLRAMVATAFWTGVRRGEACKLKREQVEWDEGLIVLRPRQTKTKKPRVTIFPDRASMLVREYLEHRDVDSPYLFCVNGGGPVNGRNFLREYQKAADRAGFQAAEGERAVLHDLRAGFVGHQLELGTPERVIMEMTGHSTHEAFDRYVRVSRRWLIDAKARAELAALAAMTRKPPRNANAVSDGESVKVIANAESELTAALVSGTS